MTDGLEDEIERVRRLAADVWLAMTPEQADQIQGVLSRLDRQQILSDPILLNASIMSRHLTTRAGSEREEYGLVASSAGVSEYCAKAVQTTSSIDDLIGYGRILIVGVRAAGDLARAEEIGAFVERRVAALRNGAEVGPGIWIRPGQLALHRGITQTLMGEFATAMTSYRRAWTKRGEPPRLHFAGAEAAGNSAMLAAVEGHFEVAETWLGRLGQYQDREGWASHMTYLGEYIARGILAADALDLPAARRAAELAGPATQPVELWPFLAVQETAVELVLGNPQRAYAALRAAAFTHDHDVSHSAICGGILLRALLDCLVALGEGNRVLAAAEESGLVRALVPMARVHLLSGHPEEALRLADSAARRGDLARAGPARTAPPEGGGPAEMRGRGPGGRGVRLLQPARRPLLRGDAGTGPLAGVRPVVRTVRSGAPGARGSDEPERADPDGGGAPHPDGASGAAGADHRADPGEGGRDHLHLGEHHQDPRPFDLPQAGGRQPRRGDREGPRAGPAEVAHSTR